MNREDLFVNNIFKGINITDFQRYLTTNDRSNFIKKMDRPFPKRLDRNAEPIISNSVRDIFKDRYKKHRKQLVLIDSRDRDRRLYPRPNNFKVYFGHRYTMVERVALTAISFMCSPYPIVNKTLTIIVNGIPYTITIEFGTYTAGELSIAIMSAMNELLPADLGYQFVIHINEQTDNTQLTLLSDTFNIVVFGTTKGTAAYIYTDTAVNTEPIVLTGLPQEFDAYNYTPFYAAAAFDPLLTYNYYYPDGTSGSYFKYALVLYKNGQQIIPTISQQVKLAESALTLPIAPALTYRTSPSGRASLTFPPAIGGKGVEFGLDFTGSQSTLLTDVFNWYECAIEDFLLLNKIIFQSHNSANLNTGCINWACMCEERVIMPNPYYMIRLAIPHRNPDILGGAIIKTQDANLQEFKANDLIAVYTPQCGIETIPIEYMTGTLDNFSDVIVNILDNNGNTLDIKCDFTLTLEVVEGLDILKDTLINSKDGEANVVGVKK
jgi:hypothetical protein